MVDYAYTLVTGKIPTLLKKIKDVGVPQKVTVQWLKTIGFTSSNDSTLTKVLAFIGFIDSSNAPTAYWKQFRGGQSKQVVAEALRKSYAALFSLYPDAEKRSLSELTNFFATNSNAGQKVISSTVSTFKALVSEADFDGITPTQTANNAEYADEIISETKGTQTNRTEKKLGPSLHIDIQIHISPESTSAQIDQIFESMAKHLYGKHEV